MELIWTTSETLSGLNYFRTSSKGELVSRCWNCMTRSKNPYLVSNLDVTMYLLLGIERDTQPAQIVPQMSGKRQNHWRNATTWGQALTRLMWWWVKRSAAKLYWLLPDMLLFLILFITMIFKVERCFCHCLHLCHCLFVGHVKSLGVEVDQKWC